MSHYDNNDYGRPNHTGGGSCSGYRSGSPELLLHLVFQCAGHSSQSTKLVPHRATGSKEFRRNIMIVDRTTHQLITLTPKSASIPYTNQGQPESVNNRAESVLPDHAAQFAPLQNARTPDNFGYAPVQERAGPPDMGSHWAQALDTSIAESRRRLAGRYLNNPNAYVSTIRLEPGLSGQSQVIITLEMANIV
ncbi:hypothetical protein V8E53_010140 [Lactarius tabidus]